MVKRHWTDREDAENIKARLRADHWCDKPEVAAKVKAKNSILHKGKKRSPESVAARAAKMVGFRHTEESKAKMRKPKTEEARRNMKAANCMSGPNRKKVILKLKASRTPELRAKVAFDVQKGVCGFRLSRWSTFTDRKGRKHRMRSTWEVKLAIWLDARGKNWDYEPDILSLSDGSAYLPDFKLINGRYLEVKGYTSSEALVKIETARRDGYRISLLSERVLKRMGVLAIEWREPAAEGG